MIPRSEVELVPVGFGACLLAQARERGGCLGEALAVVVDGGIRRIPDAALARYVEARTIAPQERRAVSRRPSRRTAPDPGHVAGKAGSGERVRRLWEDAEQNEQM